MVVETRKARIRRERAEMNLRPWQMSPSQVDDGPSHWPEGTVGKSSWQEAQAWRREILRKDARYFHCEGTDPYWADDDEPTNHRKD